MDVHKIVIAYRIEHNDKNLKYFLGYADGCSVITLCTKLPQMKGFIRYFYNGG